MLIFRCQTGSKNATLASKCQNWQLSLKYHNAMNTVFKLAPKLNAIVTSCWLTINAYLMKKAQNES